MKFFIVLEFEWKNYIENKAFVIPTLILLVLAVLAMFAPRVPVVREWLELDVSTQEGMTLDETEEDGEIMPSDEAEEGGEIYAIYDEGKCLGSEDVVRAYLAGVDVKFVTSEQEVKDLVEQEEAAMGFVVHSLIQCDSYVHNKEMFGSSDYTMQVMLTELQLMQYAEEHAIDYSELVQYTTGSNVVITENVLGKDSTMNYWYCYAFVIIIFMMIVMYGVMIAQSVTTEKSNRAIEVLVTSIDTNSLLFGKVMAGAISGILQVALILGTLLIGYRCNRAQWGELGEILDMFLDIPGNVILTFAFFGIGGYLFYAFLYGAMGALVSKTEDISKSASGLQMLIMIAYFVALAQLGNVDGIVMRVASYLPFTSYTAMFACVAMGTVAWWEVAISGVILAVSVVGAGLLGSALYRMGTLRYGNPIKFSSAIRALRQK